MKIRKLVTSWVLTGFTCVPICHADVTVYVSPSGDDSATGTAAAPVATLTKAIDIALDGVEIYDGLDIHINLYGGEYYLSSTLEITDKLLRQQEVNLFIEAVEGECPVLSGGEPVANWSVAGNISGLPDVGTGKILEASMPSTKYSLRQLWVNGNRVPLASNHDDLSLSRLICRDSDGDGLVIPALDITFSRPESLEMTIIQDWAMNILRVKSLKTEGERTYVKFQPTEAEIEFKRPWPILRASEDSYSNHFFKLSNAIELLNRPREWYNDNENGKLYYWPAKGEDTDNILAVAPRLETVVAIKGTPGNPVRNITFRGVTFSHSTWTRPAEAGHIALQAGQFLYDAYSKQTATANNVAWVGRPAAGVSVEYAENISFENCRFEHFGSTGLDFVSGVKGATVRGSVFNDIGGNGILAGFFGDEDFEVHQAWNPADARLVCDNILIDNNYISHPGVDDYGCLAIAVGYASDVTISHNEIFDTPYSAINMGWGWVKDESVMRNNHIKANYIHSFSNKMRDSGAIYTLSSQPNSSIESNRIEGVGDPHTNPVMWDMRHSQFDIYTDEGTDYYTVKNNWCERGEISRNQNGSHNYWDNNGPQVLKMIKDAAGLEDKYKHLPSTVIHPYYTPYDSIADTGDTPDVIDYISKGDGFKLGTARAVDLNNDGLFDIVFSGGESFQVQQGGVRINMGDYHFAATQALHRLFMGNFDVADLNGDGNVDVLQSGWDFWTSYNAVLINDGKGHLTETVLKSSDTAPACGITDINCDGLPDYFFVGNGTANSFYLQKPDRTFNPSRSLLSLPGGFSDPNAVYADFNNDGFVDIVLMSNKTGGVFTEIFWNDGKGNFTMGNSGIEPKGTRGGMAYADVNCDGWLDLVVGGTIPGEAWNTTAAEGGKTVTLYLNDQKGHFIKHQVFAEYMFDNTTRPTVFTDWNNDGYSDLILTGWNMSEGNISRTNVFLNDGNGNFTLSDVSLPGVSESAVEAADFSDSGRCDLLVSGNCNGGYQGFSTDRRIAVLCKNKSVAVNTIPSTPTNLSATVEGNSITLKWDAASDAETPTESLSYNFYIRDLSTGLYYTSPNADIETGQRRICSIGNAWLNRSITLNNLQKGDYAWSVQALDASNAGSEFAPEQMFSIELSGLDEVTENEITDAIVSVNGNQVIIESLVKDAVDIYTIDGRLIATARLVNGYAKITLPRGFYVIDRIKVPV